MPLLYVTTAIENHMWRRDTNTVPSIKHRPSYFFGARSSNRHLVLLRCILAVGPQVVPRMQIIKSLVNLQSVHMNKVQVE